jgi:hypothetical protein
MQILHDTREADQTAKLFLIRWVIRWQERSQLAEGVSDLQRHRHV